jgi:hypothetical protein
VLAAASCSVAAAEDAASMAAKETDDTIQVPEIIIDGRTLSQLKSEIYKAEEAFYEAFNEVNTEGQYHTVCGIETATEMQQKVHVCKPEFISDAYQEELWRGLQGGLVVGLAAFRINARMPLYKEHVRDLVQKNPKLRKALGYYYGLTEHYEAVRREKLKGKWFVWD